MESGWYRGTALHHTVGDLDTENRRDDRLAFVFCDRAGRKRFIELLDCPRLSCITSSLLCGSALDNMGVEAGISTMLEALERNNEFAAGSSLLLVRPWLPDRVSQTCTTHCNRIAAT